jgi:hypothetical protein
MNPNQLENAQWVSQLVQQVGFPIAVAFWLLWRTDKKLVKMTEVLEKIATTMALIEKSMNGGR